MGFVRKWRPTIGCWLQRYASPRIVSAMDCESAASVSSLVVENLVQHGPDMLQNALPRSLVNVCFQDLIEMIEWKATLQNSSPFWRFIEIW